MLKITGAPVASETSFAIGTSECPGNPTRITSGRVRSADRASRGVRARKRRRSVIRTTDAPARSSALIRVRLRAYSGS